MTSNIGIKIANGEFYPLIEENSSIKKRLVLTTVHDNQPSVQIDLFRNNAASMSDAQYIGSLVVENIQPKPKGSPSIEMIISSDANGEIIADAIDLDTGSGGEHYVLTVSLKSLDTAPDMEVQDFDLESNEEPPSSLYRHASKIRREKKQRSPLCIILFIILLILLGLASWLFFLGGLSVVQSWFDRPAAVQTSQPAQTPVLSPAPVTPTPQPEPQPTPAQVEPAPVIAEAEPVPVIQAPATPPPAAVQPAPSRTRNPPVASYNVPAVIPREGVSYVIRWGDTLWDIAAAFYREPRLYTRIAQHNNIRNPNLIISGRTIRIPPRN